MTLWITITEVVSISTSTAIATAIAATFMITIIVIVANETNLTVTITIKIKSIQQKKWRNSSRVDLTYDWKDISNNYNANCVTWITVRIKELYHELQNNYFSNN